MGAGAGRGRSGRGPAGTDQSAHSLQRGLQTTDLKENYFVSKLLIFKFKTFPCFKALQTHLNRQISLNGFTRVTAGWRHLLLPLESPARCKVYKCPVLDFSLYFFIIEYLSSFCSSAINHSLYLKHAFRFPFNTFIRWSLGPGSEAKQRSGAPVCFALVFVYPRGAVL